jgi:hypothetical protein
MSYECPVHGTCKAYLSTSPPTCAVVVKMGYTCPTHGITDESETEEAGRQAYSCPQKLWKSSRTVKSCFMWARCACCDRRSSIVIIKAALSKRVSIRTRGGGINNRSVIRSPHPSKSILGCIISVSPT